MLDLDLTLDALMDDVLNSNRLYAVKLKPSVAAHIHSCPKVNGRASDAGVQTANGSWPRKVNGKQRQLELSEETLRDTFAHFGTVERIKLCGKAGKRTRHARIGE